MKIGIVGCGALGSYYGACLHRAGHETHFLLRSDHEAVRSDGVRVRSAAGDFVVRPHAAREPGEIGVCDLVVIGLKATANHRFPELIPPLVGPDTMVLTLQNGLGNEEALARLLSPGQVLGGLCFVCLNRTAPGEIRHIAHGRIVLGEFTGPVRERTRGVAAAFEAGGVPCTLTDSLARAHWEKLVWNIPFNGLGVAGCVGRGALEAGAIPPGIRPGPCLPTDRLLADPGWLEWVRGLMDEVIAAARALGHPVDPGWADVQIARTREMDSYRASTLVDFEQGRELELDALFLEPLRQARSAGVATPRLEALCRVLRLLAGETG